MPPVSKKADRPVQYSEVYAEVKVGDAAITVDDAKILLGWVEEPDEVKFGGDYLIEDDNGVKIRCTNNVTNRPVYMGVVETLKQEHLRKRWVFNGEPIIIGKFGSILNGQHTLLSLVLAEQTREKDQKTWGKVPVVLNKMVVFGVEENDATVNTMDTCKPRTLADVIYRAPYFAKMKASDRKMASRTTDYAIRFLWARTGVSTDAYAIRRTHAEAIDFLGRHSKILECVKHVMEENTENRIGKYVSLGTAAGLLYMMGCSATVDPALGTYITKRREKDLDWSTWDRACEFWTLLAAGGEDMKEVRYTIAELVRQDGSGGGSALEHVSIVVKAWNEFSTGTGVIHKEFLKLKYHVGEEGFHRLIEVPTVGGIDLGDPSVTDTESDDVPSENEISKAKAEIDAMKRAGQSPTAKGKLKPQDVLLKSFKDDNADKTVLFKEGDVYTVYDSEDANIVAARFKRKPVDGRLVMTEDEFNAAWSYLGTDKFCGIVVEIIHGEVTVTKKWKGK